MSVDNDWIIRLEKEVKELLEDIQYIKNKSTYDILIRHINKYKKLIEKYK